MRRIHDPEHEIAHEKRVDGYDAIGRGLAAIVAPDPVLDLRSDSVEHVRAAILGDVQSRRSCDFAGGLPRQEYGGPTRRRDRELDVRAAQDLHVTWADHHGGQHRVLHDAEWGRERRPRSEGAIRRRNRQADSDERQNREGRQAAARPDPHGNAQVTREIGWGARPEPSYRPFGRNAGKRPGDTRRKLAGQLQGAAHKAGPETTSSLYGLREPSLRQPARGAGPVRPPSRDCERRQQGVQLRRHVAALAPPFGAREHPGRNEYEPNPRGAPHAQGDRRPAAQVATKPLDPAIEASARRTHDTAWPMTYKKRFTPMRSAASRMSSGSS
ncbi:MAG TPA: hypothetical protein EYQ27_12595 [Gemmatimonadetes bacterium]|nr:hypothetical protein [Gemmatimonadota bacterium]